MRASAAVGVLGVCMLLAVAAVAGGDGLQQPGDGAEHLGDARTLGVFSYVDPPNGPEDFLQKSSLVFLGQPLGPEVILQDQDADSPIQIMGQKFAVARFIKGAVDGPAAMVIRTHLVGATVQEQPPFTYPLYLLGLETTQDSYGVPAWYTVGGPSGRIPFEPTGLASDYISVVESEGNQVQTALVALTPDQVIEDLSGS